MKANIKKTIYENRKIEIAKEYKHLVVPGWRKKKNKLRFKNPHRNNQNQLYHNEKAIHK